MQTAADTATVRRELGDRKQAVEQFLTRYFAAKLDGAAEVSPETRELVEFLAGFVLAGGKRVRACLVAAGYRCWAPEPDDDRLVTAGAAMELLHAFLLAHDDVFDRDAIRHGEPTLHRRFSNALASRFPSPEIERYGASLAILAGDVAATLAFDVLASTPAEPARVIAATRTLARVALETGYGEALDVLAELHQGVDERLVAQIHRYKTAKYTIEGPLHIGAILAGARPAQLAGLSAFAVPLGIAYQLQDDLLGVFGSERVTGKPVGADLREGKHTLLAFHGLEGPFASQLRPLLGRRDLSDEQVGQAQQYLRDGGSVTHSEERIANLVTESVAALDHLDARPDGLAFLRGFAIELVGRIS
mgnify:CR=1 FL=1